MTKSCISSFLFLLVCSFATAQKNYKNGWVVGNNGDTTKGQLFVKEWNNNPSRISFKTNNETSFEIKDIHSFGLDDGTVTFRRFEITKHLTPNSEDKEYKYDEDSTQTSTEWLRLLVPGKTILYSLSTMERQYYYYQAPGKKITELEYSNGIKNFSDIQYKDDPRYEKTGIVENPFFKNQLLEIATSNGLSDKLGSLADRTTYTENSLSSFFEKLNNNKRKSEYKMISSFGIGAGIINNVSNTSGEPGTMFYNATVKGATAPFVKIIYELRSSKPSKLVSFHADLLYTNLNTTGSKKNPLYPYDSAAFEMKNTFLELRFMVRITLNPLSKARFYIEGGSNFIYQLSGTNTQKKYSSSGMYVNSTDLLVASFRVSPVVGLGVKFNKFCLYGNYHPGQSISKYANSAWNLSRIEAGISYNFK